MSYPNLKAQMAKRRISAKAIASLLHLHQNSVYNKIRKGGFAVEDAIRIRDMCFPDRSIEYLFGEETG